MKSTSVDSNWKNYIINGDFKDGLDSWIINSSAVELSTIDNREAACVTRSGGVGGKSPLRQTVELGYNIHAADSVLHLVVQRVDLAVEIQPVVVQAVLTNFDDKVIEEHSFYIEVTSSAQVKEEQFRFVVETLEKLKLTVQIFAGEGGVLGAGFKVTDIQYLNNWLHPLP